MSFKKPFRAVPIREGKRYRRQRKRKEPLPALGLIGGAALIGTAIGIGSAATGDGGVAAVTGKLKSLAVSAGWMRANAPQPGAYYRGCDEARAAGVAPLYAGEPGYREEMDGDGDGIACEPYRGS